MSPEHYYCRDSSSACFLEGSAILPDAKTKETKKITTRVSTVSIITNTVLTLLKLLVGLLSKSSALVADAVHSASDVFGSLIVLLGVNISTKKADNSHPYGHEKFEAIASIILGNILLVVGILIGISGVRSILHQESIAVPGRAALIAAAVSIVVKEILYQYTIRAAKKINSVSLKAEAWHHRSDALSSIGSFAGILGARLGVPILDPIASLVICLFIVRVSISIFKQSIDNLVDKSCGKEETEAIRATILSIPGVLGIDDIKTRLFGNRIYVDIEISADGAQSLRDAHHIAENVHHAIEDTFPDVKHCTVHVNPA